MAKAKTFKSNTGYPVTVMFSDPSGSTRELRVSNEDGYETSDPAEIDALEGSPDVTASKASESKGSDK